MCEGELMKKTNVPDEFSNAASILQRYDNTEFATEQFQAVGVPVTTDFTDLRIRNGKYVSCTFKGNSFMNTGAAETKFTNSELISCNITGANMQFCDFSESVIRDNTPETCVIANTNFNQSSFFNAHLKTVFVENTSISQSQFLGTTIYDSHFSHATLQDNIFRNSKIINTTFIGCNMEYSEFANVQFVDSILPFHQIPYIFGGLQSLKENINSVTMSSSMQQAPRVTVKQYYDLLPAFIRYYSGQNEYFPLANISLFLGNKNAALTYIHDGLKEYIRTNDFRKLKALCKLISGHGEFNQHELSKFYFDILNYYESVPLDPADQYQFGIHIDEIKSILFSSRYEEKSQIELILKTDIGPNDIDRLAELLCIIEDCVRYNRISDDDYELELRHNSKPYSLWLLASSVDPNMLVMLIGMISSVVSGNTDLLLQAIEVSANVATIAAFIQSVRDSRSNRPQTSGQSGLPANDAVNYTATRYKKLVEKKTKVTLSFGKLYFNIENKKIYQ